MATEGVCLIQAKQMILEAKTTQSSERQACQKVADDLGVPYNTVRSWLVRSKLLDANASKLEGEEPIRRPKVHNFFLQQFGDTMIDFGVYNEGEKHILVLRQFKLVKGKRDYSNRIDITPDLIDQLKETIDRALRGPIFDDELREKMSAEAAEGCTAPYYYHIIGIDSVSKPIIIKPKKKKGKSKLPIVLGDVNVKCEGFRTWMAKKLEGKTPEKPVVKLYIVKSPEPIETEEENETSKAATG